MTRSGSTSTRRRLAPLPRTGPLQTPVAGPVSPAVSLREVTKTFTGADRSVVTAVREVTLDVPVGQMLAIVGESGSGKSTLMHCAAGLTTPDSGSISLLGTDLTLLASAVRTRYRARNVGFIFQDYNLVSSLTAAQNILLPGRIGPARVDPADLRTVLDAVGLSHRADHLPHELSGGEQQRVAIARVMATRPAVVFADEPTSALDHTTSTTILTHLRQLTRSGTTVVMVTHDLDAATFADRALVMADGAVRSEIFHPTRDTLLPLVAGRLDDRGTPLTPVEAPQRVVAHR